MNALVGFLLVYVLMMNTIRLRYPLATVGRFPLNYLGKLTGTEQYWNMFAPGPYAFGGWIRVEGQLTNGTWVNLRFPEQGLALTKPASVSSEYPTQYWRRCFVTAYEFGEQPQLQGILNYFTKQWNQTHSADEQLIQSRWVHVVQPTPEPYSTEPAAPLELRTLARWSQQQNVLEPLTDGVAASALLDSPR
jgi:hypothetical protein